MKSLNNLSNVAFLAFLRRRSEEKRKANLYKPIPKGDVPLDTYHIDHLGPMSETNKIYKYLFVVVDTFLKFTWIYPTKTTTFKEVIDRLTTQQTIFGNPHRIVCDKGTAFTSHEFQDYCNAERIRLIFTVPEYHAETVKSKGLTVLSYPY